MEQEKIEEILDTCLDVQEPEGSMNGAPWEFFVGGKDEAATSIAKMVEEELEQVTAEARHMMGRISKGRQFDEERRQYVAGLEAQLAQMREALEWLVNVCHGQSKGGDEFSPPSDDEWKEAIKDGEKALTDAPECCGRGRPS